MTTPAIIKLVELTPEAIIFQFLKEALEEHFKYHNSETRNHVRLMCYAICLKVGAESQGGMDQLWHDMEMAGSILDRMKGTS